MGRFVRQLTIQATGDGTPALTIETARAPRRCAAALIQPLEDEPSEVFAMLCLNTKLRVLASGRCFMTSDARLRPASVTGDQRFLLCSCPTLQLPFTFERVLSRLL